MLKRRHAALKVALRESETTLKLINLRYKEGESELIDVLSIQQRVFSAQSSFVAIQRAQVTQLVDLHLALGGDWQQVNWSQTELPTAPPFFQ